MKTNEASVLITGATGGLGTEIAHQLAEGGAKLLVTGRVPLRLSLLADDLREAGADVETVVADLCLPEDRERLATAAAARQVNCLINNAGINGFADFSRQHPDDIARILATSLEAPMQLTRQVLPHLLAQPHALVVNVGSVFGALPFPGFVTYSVAKAGLRAFSHSLRRELAHSSVRVIHVAPRAIDTDMNTDAMTAFNLDTKAVTDSPSDVAWRIAKAIEDETPEVFIGFQEGLAARLNGVVPTWFDRVLTGASAAARRHSL